MGEVVAALDGAMDLLFVETVESSPENKLGDEVTAVESSDAAGSPHSATQVT